MSEKRIKLMTNKLATLRPELINIEDEGHLHVGHQGAKKGGHFKLTIVSSHFKGKNMIDRHRLVYQSLGELMETEIHALSIIAKSPEEN